MEALSHQAFAVCAPPSLARWDARHRDGERGPGGWGRIWQLIAPVADKPCRGGSTGIPEFERTAALGFKAELAVEALQLGRAIQHDNLDMLQAL